MMNRKVHLRCESDGAAMCRYYTKTGTTKEWILTDDPNKVTCGRCMKTDYYYRKKIEFEKQLLSNFPLFIGIEMICIQKVKL